MSTILKALRRLEENEETQRQREEIGAGPESLVSIPPQRPGPLRRLLVWGAAIAVAVIIGAALTYGALQILGGDDAPETASTDAAPAVEKPAQAQVATAVDPSDPTSAMPANVPERYKKIIEDQAAANAERTEDQKARAAALRSTLAIRAAQAKAQRASQEQRRAAHQGVPPATRKARARRARPGASATAVAPVSEPQTTTPEPEDQVVDLAAVRADDSSRAPMPVKPASRAEATPSLPRPEPGDSFDAEPRTAAPTLAAETASRDALPDGVEPIVVVATDVLETTETSSAAEPSEPEPVAAPIPPAAIPTIDRQALPGLLVERTIWHPSSARREAIVEVDENGVSRVVTLGEGDRVGPLQVREIRPSGVTFDYRGVELQYRVGIPE